MKQTAPYGGSRRRFLRDAATLASASAFLGPSVFKSGLVAFSQDPPNGCPTPPSGGAPFQPGQDTRPVVLRKPIGSLTASELTTLQSAFQALRALGPTDPRTWLLQADVHALYCQQCANDSTQIHFMWNFFPWHRCYLYFYERILGSLAGNLDNFRLPYWDWENARSMPTPYVSPAASTNSLWDSLRNAGIQAGGNLPANDGAQSRLNQLYATQDFATFGGTQFSAGACENNPHGVIHNDVGQPYPILVDMGSLGFAARDPIFFGHHGNIDKIWSHWNALAKSGLPPTAYKNPSDAAFLNARWSFYDENSKVVSISAADVLDHETNLRYTYKLPVFHIPPIYEIVPCRLICCDPGPLHEPFLQFDEDARARVIDLTRGQPEVALVLKGVEIPPGITGTYELFSVRGDQKVLLGRFGIVGEVGNREKDKTRRMTLLLDATHAVRDLAAPKEHATLRLTGTHRGAKRFRIVASAAELRISRQTRKSSNLGNSVWAPAASGEARREGDNRSAA
jgi:polyphenol oxidase